MKRRRAMASWLNEDLILEIVRPGTGDPVTEGDVGEIVVTTPRCRSSLDQACDRRISPQRCLVRARADAPIYVSRDGWGAPIKPPR